MFSKKFYVQFEDIFFKSQRCFNFCIHHCTKEILLIRGNLPSECFLNTFSFQQNILLKYRYIGNDYKNPFETNLQLNLARKGFNIILHVLSYVKNCKLIAERKI